MKALARSAAIFLASAAMLFAGVANLAIGTYLIFLKEPATATAALAAGLLLVLAATIDRFESLKGLGLEAKTRKLDDKIAQADEVLSKLRALAELTCAAAIRADSKVGRLGVAPAIRDAYSVVVTARSVLESLGSSAASMGEVLRPFKDVMAFDAAEFCTSVLHREVAEIIAPRQRELNERRAGGVDDPIIGRLETELVGMRNFDAALGGVLTGSPSIEQIQQRLLQLEAQANLVHPEVFNIAASTIRPWLPRLRRLLETGELEEIDVWSASLRRE